MRLDLSKMLAVAVFVVATSAQAGTKSRSKEVVIDTPSELPELAQRRSESMYLHSTGSGRTFLYLEQDQGRTLAILEVTDPATIREIGRAPLNAPSPYDFVQSVSNAGALISYRDHSGFAIISFRKYKQPTLIATPGLLNPAGVQSLGQHTLLLRSGNDGDTPSADRQFDVVDLSNLSKPISLVKIHDVRQRLEKTDTGTTFLLSKEGLTVIRRPSIEEEYQEEINPPN